jgi:Holliday junction resolvase RusA-like endonuclease
MSQISFEPFESDMLVISIPHQLVSLQASREKKDKITAAIKNYIGDFPHIILCDVAVTLTIILNETKRHQTHLTPDIDNIVKPTIDAICGPAGLIANDNQMQAVTSYWLDDNVGSLDSRIEIRLLDREAVYDRNDLPAGIGLEPIERCS